MKNPVLKIEMRDIDKVFNYARNSRLHSESQVASLVKSINEFGFINPCLVDAEGKLIAGHGRVMACKKLGMEKIPVIELGHLTKTQVKAQRIADNQLPALASWDADMLRIELNELSLEKFDLPTIGFDAAQ